MSLKPVHSVRKLLLILLLTFSMLLCALTTIGLALASTGHQVNIEMGGTLLQISKHRTHGEDYFDHDAINLSITPILSSCEIGDPFLTIGDIDFNLWPCALTLTFPPPISP